MTKTPKTNGARARGPYTLAIDVGGTGLKAAILDAHGHMISERARVDTPLSCPPKTLVQALVGLVDSLPHYDRVSVGFPGVVRTGKVITAPHFGNEIWHNYPLANTLADRLGKPTRLLNDAEVQGLGIITGHGLEVVVTLGTGFGSAVFDNGRVAPHLELAHHPIDKDKTYNEYLGNAALHKHGVKKWNRRVSKMIDILHTLLNYDQLYLGGGNSRKVNAPLPAHVRLASNDTGITGGIHLWDDHVWRAISTDRNQPARAKPRHAASHREAHHG